MHARHRFEGPWDENDRPGPGIRPDRLLFEAALRGRGRGRGRGHPGAANEFGDPVLARLVQYCFMAAASCCCAGVRTPGNGVFARLNRYWTSDSCAAP